MIQVICIVAGIQVGEHKSCPEEHRLIPLFGCYKRCSTHFRILASTIRVIHVDEHWICGCDNSVINIRVLTLLSILVGYDTDRLRRRIGAKHLGQKRRFLTTLSNYLSVTPLLVKRISFHTEEWAEGINLRIRGREVQGKRWRRYLRVLLEL
jgi:hypothetical protein